MPRKSPNPSQSLLTVQNAGCAAIRPLHFNLLCQPQDAEQTNAQVVEVEFIPGHAVACRDGMRMMIVVPAFAAGEQGDPPQVTRIVARGKALGTPHMRGGVDQPGDVQTERDTEEDAPEQP